MIDVVALERHGGHGGNRCGNLEVGDAHELEEGGEEGPVDVGLGPVAGDGLVLHGAQPGAGAVGVASLQFTVGECREDLQPGRARHGRLECEEAGRCLEGPGGIAGDRLGPGVPAEGTRQQGPVVQLVETCHGVVGRGERVGDAARGQQLLGADQRDSATEERPLCRGRLTVHEGEPPVYQDRRRALNDGASDHVGQLR